jgi:hypothetical protein
MDKAKLQVANVGGALRVLQGWQLAGECRGRAERGASSAAGAMQGNPTGLKTII